MPYKQFYCYLLQLIKPTVSTFQCPIGAYTRPVPHLYFQITDDLNAIGL